MYQVATINNRHEIKCNTIIIHTILIQVFIVETLLSEKTPRATQKFHSSQVSSIRIQPYERLQPHF